MFNSRYIALGLALLANLLWATSFLGSKFALQFWSPITTVFLRFIVSSFLLIIICAFRNELSYPRGKEIGGIVAIAFTQFGFLYPLQLYGLKFISTSVSAAIMLLAPLFVLLLAAAFLSEKLSFPKLVAVFTGLTGGLVLLSSSLSMQDSHPMGITATLIAALFLGASVVITRKVALKIKPLILTLWTVSLGTVLLSPFVLWEVYSGVNILSPLANPLALGSLIYLAAFCTVIAFSIWNYALALTSAKDLASTMHIKTPAAIALGTFLAKEDFTVLMFFGTTLIVGAVFISQKKWKKRVAATHHAAASGVEYGRK